MSHQHLDDDQRRLYRVLGLHPGSDIDPYAASVLLHAAVEVTQRLLDDLHHAHLLTEPAPGRYRFHDLVRAHAAALAAEDPELDRRRALDRLFDHYAHTATVAMDLAYPYETDRRPHIAAPDTPTPGLDSPEAGEAWLDAELDNLLATATIATERGRPDHLLHLSATLHRHLRTRTHRTRALALHNQALAAAHATGNHGGEQVALYCLASVHLAQGQLGQAVTCCRQVLEIARATGDRAGEMDALNGLGDVRCLQGQYERATDRYQCALEVARVIGTRIGEEDALYGLGRVHYLQGQYERATGHYLQVLEIARAIGTRIGEEDALNGLAAVHLVQGRHEQAADRYRQALDIATEIGDRNGQFEAHHGLARCHHATGRPCDALTSFHTALNLAVALSQPGDQARSHDGLARTHLLLGRRDDARRHWETARDILTGREIDRTDDPRVTVAVIRVNLADLDAAPGKGP